MNSNHIPKPEESLDELDIDEIATVDDFIKELEAKEKDLQITSDMTIEVEDADFDEAIPDFVQEELRPAGAGDGEARVSAGLKTRIFELQNEVSSLQKRLTSLRVERNEVQEKSDRRLKDFENYKYRMDRERRGAFIDQITNLASQMLPVLDNLERALVSVEKSGSEKSVEFQQFYDGIVLVNQQVNEVFSAMGVEPITTVGETFDPNFHEAVAVEEREDAQANMILEEMLRGYRIGNRVIRHSMVKVSSSAARATAKPADEPAEPGDPSADELPDLDPEFNGENDSTEE
jgi:molecular chaperone GrpE